MKLAVLAFTALVIGCAGRLASDGRDGALPVVDAGTASEGEGERTGEGEGEGEGEGPVADDPATWALIIRDASAFDAPVRLDDDSIANAFIVTATSQAIDERGNHVALAGQGTPGCLVVDVDDLGHIQWQTLVVTDGTPFCGPLVAVPGGGAVMSGTANAASSIGAGSLTAQLEAETGFLVTFDASGEPLRIDAAHASCFFISFAGWPDGSSVLVTSTCISGSFGKVEWRDASGAQTAELDVDIESGNLFGLARIIPLDAAPPRIAVVAAAGRISGSIPFDDGTTVDVPTSDAARDIAGVLNPDGFEWAYVIDHAENVSTDSDSSIDSLTAPRIVDNNLQIAAGLGNGVLTRLGVGPAFSSPGATTSQAAILVLGLDGSFESVEGNLSSFPFHSFVIGFDDNVVAIDDVDLGVSCPQTFCDASELIPSGAVPVKAAVATSGIARSSAALVVTVADLNGLDADITPFVPDALVSMHSGDAAIIRPRLALH